MFRPVLPIVASLALVLRAAPSRADAALEPVTVTKVSFAASGDASVRLNVATGGCTRAADFRAVVSARGDGQSIRVERLHHDACELYAPQGTTVDVVVPGLHRGAIFVENPLFVGA
jgi:hypothetical protein